VKNLMFVNERKNSKVEKRVSGEEKKKKKVYTKCYAFRRRSAVVRSSFLKKSVFEKCFLRLCE
jgi:hypothetical protein